jgi:hypothetical protein
MGKFVERAEACLKSEPLVDGKQKLGKPRAGSAAEGIADGGGSRWKG